MEGEQWLVDHQEAMGCLSFEETLRMGVEWYEFLMRVDEEAQEALLSEDTSDADRRAYHDTMNSQLAQWLTPCARVEQLIRMFQQKGYKIVLADRFRKYHQEAQWILTPDAEKFAKPGFDKLRQTALDELRSGTCAE